MAAGRIRRVQSPKLSPDDVVTAALDILDRQGLPDLTMRRVASALDVQASALYWHFPNKQTLLAALADRIVLAPGIELCRELAVSAPLTRVVNDFHEVEFLGETWDVSGVPGIIVGQKLQIVRNAWRPDSAQAVGVDAGFGGRHLARRVEAPRRRGRVRPPSV